MVVGGRGLDEVRHTVHGVCLVEWERTSGVDRGGVGSRVGRNVGESLGREGRDLGSGGSSGSD